MINFKLNFMKPYELYKADCETIFLKNKKQLYRKTNLRADKTLLSNIDAPIYNALVNKNEIELLLRVHHYDMEHHTILNMVAKAYSSKFVLLANLFI